MPKIDPKNFGFTGIFFQHGDQVVLPEQLTKKWWDKKKQVVAKMTHATGVGAELEKLTTVFKAFELTCPHLPGSPTTIEQSVKDCKAFMTSGKLKAFRDQLKVVRDLAKSEAIELKKSALTKKTGEVLDEMEDAADTLWISVGQNTLGTQLEKAMEAWAAEQKANAIKNVGPTLTAVKLVKAKIPAAIQEIKKHLASFKEDPEGTVMVSNKPTPIRGVLGNAIRALCRDCTQPLGNLMKSHKAGVRLDDFDAEKVQTLATAMSKISNTKGTEFMEGVNATKADGLVKLVEGWTTKFIAEVGDAKVATKLEV
jgi:hypothetical protein